MMKKFWIKWNKQKTFTVSHFWTSFISNILPWLLYLPFSPFPNFSSLSPSLLLNLVLPLSSLPLLFHITHPPLSDLPLPSLLFIYLLSASCPLICSFLFLSFSPPSLIFLHHPPSISLSSRLLTFQFPKVPIRLSSFISPSLILFSSSSSPSFSFAALSHLIFPHPSFFIPSFFSLL